MSEHERPHCQCYQKTLDLQAECARLAARNAVLEDEVHEVDARWYARLRRCIRWAWRYRREALGAHRSRMATLRLNGEAARIFEHDLGQIKAERDAARAALRRYGAHEWQCNSVMGWGLDNPCDCGLNAALKGQP